MSAHLTPQSGALVHIDPKKRALVYRNTSIIDRVASSLGPAVDKLARRLGWGINNATVNVLDALIALSKNSDGKEDRELLLCKLRNASSSDDGVPQLAAACKNLMKYALRTQAAQTQLGAFRRIVMFTTNYPGLRHFFLRFEKLNQARATKTEVEHLWGRKLAKDNPCRREWKFFYRFAVDCICGITLAMSIEECPIEEMGIIWNEGRSGVLYDLLDKWSACRSDFHEISGLVAMRYLGGMLQLSPVWREDNQRYHQDFIRKLFRRIKMFLEDVGFGREGPLGSTEHVSDIEGIDIVSHAALEGVASCSDGSRGVEIGTICWLREFRKTVELLLTHEAKKFLPRSSRLAFAVFAKFVPQGPLASSSNSGSQKRRWCGSPGTSAPAGTDLSSPAPEEGGLAPKTMIPESPNLPSDTDANSLLSQRVEQADPHINRNGTTLEVLNDIPPMQQSITQKSGTGGSLAKAGTLPELKLVESIPHPAPCDGKPNMHASEWPTIEESLKICPPKTRGASRLKPRFRFEMYQPRKRLDGKSPKTEEITAFKGRVRKLDLNDDILQLVMDHSGNCFESQLLLVQRLELLKQAGVELCFWRHESEKRDKASKRTNAAVDHVYHCTVDGCISSLDSLQKACQHLTGLHWKLKLFKCTKCPKAWPFGRHATSHEKYDHSPPELSSLHRAIVPIQAFDPASAATV